jgi:CheY-like chemotaxis protein
MLVEDDPDIRAVAHLSLTAVGGFTVELCPSGTEALAQAIAFDPQLVLLDVVMPGMDGPTTLARLRELPSMADVPIVFMTAQAQPEARQDYLRLGAADVVAKPFDPMTLPAALQAIWDRHHA